MMSEIEEGEYVRTNRGIIAKVIYIREATRYRCTSGTISHSPERYFLDNEQKHSVSMGYVKAHSKNIIDLIEIGDIIQYKELKKLNCGTSVGQKYVGNIADEEELEEVKKEIQTKGIELVGIVTKEQFNSIMYKVGDIE